MKNKDKYGNEDSLAQQEKQIENRNKKIAVEKQTYDKRVAGPNRPAE